MRALPVDVQARLDRATMALERMERERLRLSPAPYLALMFARKEIVLSMQIDGRAVGLCDSLAFDLLSDCTNRELTCEAAGYEAALAHGLSRLRDDPRFSAELLLGMHRRLAAPWSRSVGSREYVEPSGLREIARALDADRTTIPRLLFAGIVHARLQTARLFGRQNGAMSRLVTLLFLAPAGAVTAPSLCPSLYLTRNRGPYYRLLDGVRDSAAWDPWLSFFADSVTAAAENSLLTGRRVGQILDTDRNRMAVFGTAARSARTVHAALQRWPVASVGSLVRDTGLGVQAVTLALHRLRALGIVREITGRRQHCVYSYDRYLDVLVEGTESPVSRAPPAAIRAFLAVPAPAPPRQRSAP